MKIYYFSEKKKIGKDAGNKARSDVESILKELGYQQLYPYRKSSNSNIGHVFSILNVLRSVNKDDYIVLQYPLPIGYNFLLKTINKMRNTIIVVHDLPELRAGRANGKDVRQLKNAKYVISHNKQMDKYLIKWGVDKEKIIDLGIFDYLATDIPKKTHAEDRNLLCYAGNLAKSDFIYKLSSKLKKSGINIYGINFDNTKGDHLNYCGSYDSEIIYRKIKGRFGLVWDGNMVEKCSGVWGEYLKYNNPHKVSMYLVAGMPIIIWDKSALAKLIQENHLGVTVASLDEIPKKISSLSSENYLDMVNNVYLFRNGLIQGNMFKNSMKEVKRRIGENYDR